MFINLNRETLKRKIEEFSRISYSGKGRVSRSVYGLVRLTQGYSGGEFRNGLEIFYFQKVDVGARRTGAAMVSSVDPSVTRVGPSGHRGRGSFTDLCYPSD